MIASQTRRRRRVSCCGFWPQDEHSHLVACPSADIAGIVVELEGTCCEGRGVIQPRRQRGQLVICPECKARLGYLLEPIADFISATTAVCGWDGTPIQVLGEWRKDTAP